MKRFLLSLLTLLSLGTLALSAAEGIFELVTSTNPVEVNDELIIVNGTKGMSFYAGGNNFPTVDIPQAVDNVITLTTQNVAVVKVVSSGNSDYPFQFETIYNNNSAYLYSASTSSNHMKATTSKSTAASYLKITMASGNAVTITFNNTSRNVMMYNNSNKIFSCYDSGQQAVYLYKKQQTGPVAFEHSWPENISFEAGEKGSETDMLKKLGITGEHPEFLYVFQNDIVVFDDNTRTYEAKEEGADVLNLMWEENDTFTEGESDDIAVEVKAKDNREKTAIAWDVEDGKMTVDKSKVTSITPKLLGLPDGETAYYTSSKPDIASINKDGVITIKAEGETEITATFYGNDTYLDSEAKFILTVTDGSNLTAVFDYAGTDSKVESSGVISASYAKNGGSGDPGWFSSGDALRLYGGNSITFTANKGYYIKKITVEVGSSNNTWVSGVSCKAQNVTSGKEGTLDGFVWTYTTGTEPTTVVLQNGGTSGHTKITKITVTYGVATPVYVDYPHTWPTAISFEEGFEGTEADLLKELGFEQKDIDLTYTFANTDVIEYAENVLKAKTVGTTTLTVEWAQQGDYKAGKAENIAVSVTAKDNRADVEFTWNYTDNKLTANMWDSTTVVPDYEVTPADAVVTLTSNNEAVAKIDDEGNITLVAAGEATITATIAETTEFKGTSASFTLTVNDLAKPVFTNNAQSIKVGEYVEITCETEGVAITYTINGGAEKAYSEPFKVTANMAREDDGKVTFIAFANIGTRSTQTQKTYTVNPAPTFDFSVKDPLGMTSTNNGDTYEAESEFEADNGVKLIFAGTTKNSKQEVVNAWRSWITTTPSYELRLVTGCSMTFIAPTNGRILSIAFKSTNSTCNKLSYDGTALSGSTNATWTAPEGSNIEEATFNVTAAARLSEITVTVAVTPLSMHFYDEDVKVEFGHGADIILWNGETKKIQFTVGHGHKLHYCDHKAGEEAHAAGRAALEDEDHVWVHTEDGTVTLSGNGTLYLATEKDGEMTPRTYFTYTTTTQTGIESVAAEAEAEAEYFNLQGVRVANPAAGVYLRRQGGAVSKVVVR